MLDVGLSEYIVLNDLNFVLTIGDADVLEDVKEWCAEVRGRMDWEPDTELDSPVIRPYPENRVTTLVIQRDRLGACLTQHIENNYSGLVMIRKTFRISEFLRQPGS